MRKPTISVVIKPQLVELEHDLTINFFVDWPLPNLVSILRKWRGRNKKVYACIPGFTIYI